MVRLMTRRQMVRMKMTSWCAWWVDDDHEHRLPILAVWLIAIPLIAGQAFLWFNTPWATTAKTGVSLIMGGVLMGIAAIISFLLREEMA